jgi:hypothetical protein
MLVVSRWLQVFGLDFNEFSLWVSFGFFAAEEATAHSMPALILFTGQP